jgi:uncharacterized protein
MKFQPDTAIGVNVITRHDGPRLWVGNAVFAHSVLVPWQGAVQPWDATAPTGLTALHFEQALALQPEVLIFGSGAALRFVSPALYRSLIERGIGFETMDTRAACRTYNVLASEGRSVVAALLLATG